MSPNSYFYQLSVYFISCLMLRGFSLLNLSSKWTSNVQELLTLLKSVGTGSTLFSLKHCIQVSSSSPLSHFQSLLKSSDSEQLDKFLEVLVEF